MDNIKEIKINCDAKNYANLDEFNELQGNLKDLTELNFNKLKLSILKFGFIAPLFAYKDNKGKLWIMDAHQRVRVLKHLRDVDGYLVPKLPYNLIQAKDKRQAKEMLLAINSRYGKMTADGLYEFINEPKFEIDFENIKTLLDFPDLNLDSFDLGFNKDVDYSAKNKDEEVYSKEIKAPIYEPKNDKPSIWDLYDTNKCNQLTNEIEGADITNEERLFLRTAAYRHIVFDFSKIADYYANASKEMQMLIEKSGLVIIDFNKAIEYGFVKMSKDIAELSGIDYDEE